MPCDQLVDAVIRMRTMFDRPLCFTTQGAGERYAATMLLRIGSL